MPRGRKPAPPKEFMPPSPEKLYQLFDVCEEFNDRLVVLNEEKKVLTKEISDRMKHFANEIGCKPKKLRNAFKYYLDNKQKSEDEKDTEDPLYQLMIIVDEISAEDYKPEDYSFKEAVQETEA